MSLGVWQGIFLAFALIMANMPWLSQRCFLFLQCEQKSPWLRLLEWLVLYFVVGGVALAMERDRLGEIHQQGWEFYTVTLSLFLVFAFPGFIYRFVR